LFDDSKLQIQVVDLRPSPKTWVSVRADDFALDFDIDVRARISQHTMSTRDVLDLWRALKRLEGASADSQVITSEGLLSSADPTIEVYKPSWAIIPLYSPAAKRWVLAVRAPDNGTGHDVVVFDCLCKTHPNLPGDVIATMQRLFLNPQQRDMQVSVCRTIYRCVAADPSEGLTGLLMLARAGQWLMDEERRVLGKR
jgi:hypothetical protein